MRREAVEYLRDNLVALHKESPNGLGFNMNSYVAETGYCTRDRTRHKCGTVACLAGWTVDLMRLNGQPRKRPLSPARLMAYDDHGWGIFGAAGKTLGLNASEMRALFIPEDVGPLGDVSLRTAISTLNRFLKTGEIEWK
jgi:hypothetical protein